MRFRINNKIVLLLSVLLVLLTITACEEKNESVMAEDEQGNFVTSQNGQFILDGEVFRFAGTNNYYLHYKNNEMIDDVIENAKEMNLKVIRMWAYLDGVEGSMVDNNAYMQTAPGVFDQIPDGAINGFEAMDYALMKASELDMKVVLVLTNNWDAFGGVNQYVAWSDTANEHDDFYTDTNCKDMYKTYADYLINRENTYTGLAYKEDPTIFAWELMNEPRCDRDKSGETILAWADEMSSHIKSLDSNHMVTLGDEGFFNRPDETNWAYNGYSGVDFERILALEHIDYGTFHLYPDHWGDDFEDAEESGSKWIEDHALAAQAVGKPAVLEEFGLVKTSQENRDYVYETWTNKAYEINLAGTMFWILTGLDNGDSQDSEGLYQDYDGFRVVNDGGRTDELLTRHAKEMSGEIVEKAPAVYINSPYLTEKVTGVFAFKANIQSYGRKIDQVAYVIGEEAFEASIKGSLVVETYDYPWDGETEVRVEVLFDDGSVAVDSILANITNKQTEIVVGDYFAFENDLEGFEVDLGTMASVGDKGSAHSDLVGDGAFMVDASWSGVADWQEIRILNANLPSIGQAISLEYDLYYDIEVIDPVGGVRPYAVANPGWVKMGLDENDLQINDLPLVEFEGKTYAHQHVVIEVTGASGATELYIGIVGNGQPYLGPIYLDNIQIFVEQFVE